MRDLVLGLQVTWQVLDSFVLNELVWLNIPRDHTCDEPGCLFFSTVQQEGFSRSHA